MNKYDIIVIGAGSAGLGASGVANMLELKTLVIEKEARNVGGDCLNYGCVPSKALIHIAKMFHHAKQASRFGSVESGKADIKKVMQYIHQKQDTIRHHENADYLRDQGIDVEIGEAKFLDENVVSVGGKNYTGRKIFLCTGSRPRRMKIEGDEEVKIYDNESLFWEMKELPENFVVIGGGPIGCEMSQAFSRLGSNVVIVNRGERLLGKERPEIAEILKKRFEKEGIKVINNAEVESFYNGKAVVVDKGGVKIEVNCTDALLAIGRIINTENMGLKAGGIALTDLGKIITDDYLRTTNPKVYALGDAAGRYQFSHGAEKHVRMVWNNLLMPFWKKKDTTHDLSWVTFTDPEIATWGYSEEELHNKKINFWRQDQHMGDDDRAIVDEYEDGRLTLFMTRGKNVKSRKIIGGTMIANGAGEMSQELMLASKAGIPLKTLFERIYPYPVGSRINQQTIRGVYDKSFTEMKKNIGRKIFRWLY